MSITYGINPVREQLKVVSSGSVYFCGGKLSPKLKELETKARASELDVIFLGREEFQKRFGEWEHQGIVLESNTTYSFICSEEDFYNELKDIENTDTVLLLDGVKDVGNLGAILRSALLFNVKYVVLPKNNKNPKNNAYFWHHVEEDCTCYRHCGLSSDSFGSECGGDGKDTSFLWSVFS